MLVSIEQLTEYSIVAIDGEIGTLRGVFFDDSSWKVPYFILDTGTWLPGRSVIISPQAIKRVDHNEKQLHVTLTREKIETSPEVDEDEPLSIDMRTRLDRYYGWTEAHGAGGIRLQNTRDVIGSYIEAKDGDIGHVEDLILDDATWTVRYMIVDTVNWWPGKKVLISPHWIESMKWEDKKVLIDLTRDQIKSSPEYTSGEVPARDYEERLYGHYRRPRYWQGEDVSSTRRVT